MIVLFFGMSGIDIHSSLTKFLKEFKPFRTTHFEARKPVLIKMDFEIEEVFYQLYPNIDRAKNVWVELILQKSYPVLEKLWLDAFENILTKVKKIQSENARTPIFINLHSCYLHKRTKEYIALLQIDKLKMLNPKMVITLIDDIYDIHHRLTKFGGIYCGIEASMVEMIQRYFRLLDWRSKETMMARFIANHLGCKNIVFAIKHSYDTFSNLIFEDYPTAYLSHPISEIRRLEKSENPNAADEIKLEIKALSEYLQANFTTFAPTTIDEYRIKSETIVKTLENGEIRKEKAYFPVLTKRWQDEIYQNPQDILYQASGFKDINSLWHQAKPDEINSEVSHLLAVLADTISNQVSTRDYTMVEQSELIIIYRPLFNGNGSGGVAEEFNYFRALRSDTNNDKSSCFIYCPEKDINDYYKNVFNDKIRYYLNNRQLKNTDGTKFAGISQRECSKLTEKIPTKAIIFDLLNEVLGNHNLVIDVESSSGPLSKHEPTEFKNKFVKKVLDDFAALDDYRNKSTLFITDELTIESFCNKIKESINIKSMKSIDELDGINDLKRTENLENINDLENEQSDID
jgi:hypothetical protein